MDFKKLIKIVDSSNLESVTVYMYIDPDASSPCWSESYNYTGSGPVYKIISVYEGHHDEDDYSRKFFRYQWEPLSDTRWLGGNIQSYWLEGELPESEIERLKSLEGKVLEECPIDMDAFKCIASNVDQSSSSNDANNSTYRDIPGTLYDRNNDYFQYEGKSINIDDFENFCWDQYESDAADIDRMVDEDDYNSLDPEEFEDYLQMFIQQNYK